jgi:hypothetical protein
MSARRRGARCPRFKDPHYQRKTLEGHPKVCHCGNHRNDHERVNAFWDLILRSQVVREDEGENKDSDLLAK